MAEEEVPIFQPPAAFASNAHCSSLDQYKEMYKESIESPETFWSTIAERFHWERKWEKVGPTFNFEKEEGKPISIEWFTGGKTNLCYNCLDRNVEQGKGDKVCFIWEGNDPRTDEPIKKTYAEVLKEVQIWANVLKAQGVGKGDRVAIYMPMVLELPMVMLACARIGAVHSVIFGGFAAESMSSRIIDSAAKVIVTTDGVMRGEKLIELKKVADTAAESAAKGGVQVKSMIVVRRLGNEKMEASKKGSSVQWIEGRDMWYHDIRDKVSSECAVEWMDAEDPLFMLYTSGSTGNPKGVLHTTGGYMIGAYTSVRYIFDMHDEDIYWCTADCGWITGHTYIAYGPLLNGATQIIFEGVPTFPDAGRLWEIVDKHAVTIFYTAPTAVRALMQKGNDPVKKHHRTSLRLLGSVGEPINPEAWHWYNDIVGNSKCPIVDTWWQTETGSILITPLPGATPTKPGSATFPFFGCDPRVIDIQSGKELEGPGSGYLCIKRPWPSMMRTVWGDHGRFEATYFSQQKGYYFTGDACRRDKDGYIWITGRVDDVVNVSGHRIGTAEVESVIASNPNCAEAAVVGYPHAVKGEGIYVYAVPMAGVEPSPELEKAFVAKVRSEIGAFAAPDVIHWAPTGVPKTRSGKIMRRILRKIAHGEEDSLGDISTLADPSVVEMLLKTRPTRK